MEATMLTSENLRANALRILARHLSTVTGGAEPKGIAIYCDGTYNVLSWAIKYIEDNKLSKLPVVQVGVHLRDLPRDSNIHTAAGSGADRQHKLRAIKNCITSGRLPRNILLLTPMFGAPMLATRLTQEAEQVSGLTVQAAHVPFVELDDNDLRRNARQIHEAADAIISAIRNKELPPIPAFAAGGEALKSYDMLGCLPG